MFSLTFLLAAVGGPGHTSLKTAYHSSIGRLAGSGGKGYTGAVGWVPSWTSGSEDLSSDPNRDGLREPTFTVDRQSGLEYPPDVNPMVLNDFKRAKATFVALVRNEEASAMMSSMRGVEDRFNRKFGVSVGLQSNSISGVLMSPSCLSFG